MSYRAWREKTETRLSPTERVILVLMLLGVLVLLAYRVFDAVPRAESGVVIEQRAASGAAVPVEDAPVDVNTATRVQLMTLPGIGEAKADAILAYREEHGPFESVDDLLGVKGIGPAVLEQLREHIVIGKAETVSRP